MKIDNKGSITLPCVIMQDKGLVDMVYIYSDTYARVSSDLWFNICTGTERAECVRPAMASFLEHIYQSNKQIQLELF